MLIPLRGIISYLPASLPAKKEIFLDLKSSTFKLVDGMNSLIKPTELLFDWKKIIAAKNLKGIGYTRDLNIGLFSYFRSEAGEAHPSRYLDPDRNPMIRTTPD